MVAGERMFFPVEEAYILWFKYIILISKSQDILLPEVLLGVLDCATWAKIVIVIVDFILLEKYWFGAFF